MVVLICGDCGHATDVKDDAFAEELLQLEVFHAPCKGTEGKGVMRRGEPFKHNANVSVRPLHSESTSEDNNALVDPRLELTPAESDLAGQGKHMLIRAPEYKHVVKISLKKYLDWRFASVSNAEDAFDFIGSFVQHGWKGIQNEYKTLADLNRTSHGILPDYLFAEGFEGAQRLCSERVSCVINPNCVEAVNIAIVWED